MSERRDVAPDEVLAAYVRGAMRVEMPATLIPEVLRVAGATPQASRPWFHAFGPFVPALAAIAATVLIAVVGLMVTSPRPVGPGPDESTAPPSPTPAPTLTPEDARVLTEPGDSIIIPALDGEGQFGTITVRRGEEKAGYEDFVPFAFGDVFFVELYVTYQPTRATEEQYGEWEFAIAVDADDDGSVADEVPQRGVGLLGMEGMPGFDAAPQPLLYGMRSGEEVLEGWLVLEIPASAADHDIHLLYGHAEWENGIQNLAPDTSALLRVAGEPVGVTAFDPDAFPTHGPEESVAMPSMAALPTPPPSPAATFEPLADAAADASFEESQSCTNDELGLTITFPADWYANDDTLEDSVGFPVAPCTFFSPEEVDEQIFAGPGGQPFVGFFARPDWTGGVEDPIFERFPLGERMAWRLSYLPDQMSYGMIYLVELGDDPYGPFLTVGTGTPELRAVIERMLLLLEFDEGSG